MPKPRRFTEARIAATVLALVVLAPWSTASSGAATPVACGDVLDEPGQYVLTGDLVDCVAGILITASGVHFNLSGYTLDGPGFNRGIVVASAPVPAVPSCPDPGPSDVHITNGTVTGWTAGIAFCNADGNHVNGVNVLGNRASGVALIDGSDDNTVNGNDTSGNQYGIIILRSSNRNQFIDNVCNANMVDDPNAHAGCVFVADSSENIIASNEMTGNGLFGVEIARGSGNIVRANIISETLISNIGTGIRLLATEGNAVRSNTANNNKRGITLSNVHGTTVQSNSAQANVVFDLAEGYTTAVPPCSSNIWKSNVFDTANEACIK